MYKWERLDLPLSYFTLKILLRMPRRAFGDFQITIFIKKASFRYRILQYTKEGFHRFNFFRRSGPFDCE